MQSVLWERLSSWMGRRCRTVSGAGRGAGSRQGRSRGVCAGAAPTSGPVGECRSCAVTARPPHVVGDDGRLRHWHVRRVVMESTCTYWKGPGGPSGRLSRLARPADTPHTGTSDQPLPPDLPRAALPPVSASIGITKDAHSPCGRSVLGSAPARTRRWLSSRVSVRGPTRQVAYAR